eukprot:4296252-Pleurochrysis_carterae.AAC.2
MALILSSATAACIESRRAPSDARACCPFCRAPQIFTPLATKSGDSVSGSLAAKYLFPFGVSAETTLTTAGTLATQLEGAVAKGMILTVDAETGKSAALASGKATLDYKKDMMTCKGSYDYYKGEAAGEQRTQMCPRTARAFALSAPTRPSITHANAHAPRTPTHRARNTLRPCDTCRESFASLWGGRGVCAPSLCRSFLSKCSAVNGGALLAKERTMVAGKPLGGAERV